MNKFLALIVLAMSLGSCYYDNQEDLYPIDPNDCKTDSLTYNNYVGDLINLTCSTSGCHSAGGQPPALTNYQEVFSNLGRIEVRALQEKTMPPSGPMNQCNQSQLTQWIADGAPEN